MHIDFVPALYFFALRAQTVAADRQLFELCWRMHAAVVGGRVHSRAVGGGPSRSLDNTPGPTTPTSELAWGCSKIGIYIASHILPLSILGIRSPSIATAEAAFRSTLLIIPTLRDALYVDSSTRSLVPVL